MTPQCTGWSYRATTSPNCAPPRRPCRTWPSATCSPALPNRALILDRAEQMLARARRTRTSVAALFIDLDGFKDVNDTLGHRVGDELLRLVAARLSDGLRASDTIGRLGGDEFVVLAEGPSSVAPDMVAVRLLQALEEPFPLDSEARPLLHVSASIGIVSGIYDSAGDLLRDADIALYEAKAGGRNRYVTFHPAMRTLFQSRFDLERDLRQALRQRAVLRRIPAHRGPPHPVHRGRRGVAAVAPPPSRRARARPTSWRPWRTPT